RPQARAARLRRRRRVVFDGLGDLICEVVKSSEIGLREVDLSQDELVEDPDRRAVLNGPREVVDVHVVSENLLGRLIIRLDLIAREPEKGRTWQCINYVHRQDLLKQPMSVVILTEQ